MAVQFGKWEKIERKELTPPIPFGVEKIEILNLDEGSKNDGTETFGNYGMIYGKSYKLRVSKFAYSMPPKNKNDIKWQAVYLGKGDILTLVHIEKTGDEIVFNCDNLDYCGQTISFYAFVRESGKEQNNKAKLEVFCHNRFRWFDSNLIENQIKDRKEAWKISQNKSSLCGMAALFYILAKKFSDEYSRIATDIFRKGECVIKDKIIAPSSNAQNIMYEMKPNDREYISLEMEAIDWIVLATSRSYGLSLFGLFSYKGIEKDWVDMLKAVNCPRMMVRMSQEIIPLLNIDSFGLNEVLIQQKKRPIGGRVYDYFSNSDLRHIQEIEKKFSKGHQIIMMIDAQMIKDIVSYSYVDILTESHWVVYEGGLLFFDKYNKKTNDIDKAQFLTFKIYTWGRNCEDSYKDRSGILPDKSDILICPDYKISVECFKSTFYGYIELY